MGKKLKFCLVGPLAALALLAFAGPAAAGQQFAPNNPFENGDPQNLNIPYVAWAGEEVRLVKCIDNRFIDTELLNGPIISGDAEWAVVDWSGVDVQGNPSRDPAFFDDVDRRTGDFEPTGFGPIDDQDDRTCWAIDIESNKPGMAVVKMAIDGSILRLDPGPGSPILKHQFLVIWMTMGNPELEELSNLSFPGLEFGDPLGDGNFHPADFDGDGDNEFGHGAIRVTLTGSFPLGQNFADDLDGDADTNVVTLPADWATLAGRYAVGINGKNPNDWDIHDDQIEPPGLLPDHHTLTSFCNVPKTQPVDEVDNCRWEFNTLGGILGPFSRVVGGFYALGPFDPVRPGTSYFPDGKLDDGDAPMPAARVDLSLSGTFGAFIGVRKSVVYSHDRTGNFLDDPTTAPAREGAHNLYAPFYAALIPASSPVLARIPTSGTHGALANNFPGYQAGPLPGLLGIYEYWRLLNTHSRNLWNACNDVGGEDGQAGGGNGAIPKPTGYDAATVYTDEHGEAIIGFLPDVGVTLAPDAQGLCDLGENPPAGGNLLATATIDAEAQDPFQPVFDEVRSSNTLTKNLFSLASKSLDCVPKGPNEAFCVETVKDIRGNPVEGAVVAFTREPNGIISEASLVFGGFDTTGQGVLLPGSFGLFDAVILSTNAKGQAGIVLKSTLPGLVDVDAENLKTRNGALGVQRVRCLRFAGDGVTLPIDGPTCAGLGTGGGPGPTGPTGVTGPTGTTGAGNTNTGSTNTGSTNVVTIQGTGAAATVVSLAGNPVPAAKPEAAKPTAKKVATKLASARFVMVKGQRYLVLRANGSAKTAQVRITLVMRTGRVVKPVVRTIRTNRSVRVANLVISKHVQAVRVSVLR